MFALAILVSVQLVLTHSLIAIVSLFSVPVHLLGQNAIQCCSPLPVVHLESLPLFINAKYTSWRLDFCLVSPRFVGTQILIFLCRPVPNYTRLDLLLLCREGCLQQLFVLALYILSFFSKACRRAASSWRTRRSSLFWLPYEWFGGWANPIRLGRKVPSLRCLPFYRYLMNGNFATDAARSLYVQSDRLPVHV